MAKPNKNTAAVRNDSNVVNEEMDKDIDAGVVANSKTWLRRPDWELTFKNKEAVINGVNDEDFELLQRDNNDGFAKELVHWVNSNSGKLKISRFVIKASVWNCGTRGPGAESASNPFKLRPVKASRNTSGEKTVRTVAREITTQDVVAFLLAGKLDTEAFKEAMDGVRNQRMEQIRKLQMELASFDTFEKLATSGRTIGG